MSTINVRSSRDAAGAVNYVLYGNSRKHRTQLIESGHTRAASFAISVAGDLGASPGAFIERTEMMAGVHGRKVMLQSYVLAFAPDEFDVTDLNDLNRIRDIAVTLAERMHAADYLIVVHADSAGGHAHAHILVASHNNLTGKSLQRYTSWKHGLRQLNDDLMRDEGLRVLPDPEQPKPDWELRREAFSLRGFEQTLGDKVYAALSDPHSVDQQAYEQVLEEQGIRLAVTHRDGWTYKMRRSDNGKLGRKKASALTPEFTAEGATSIFDIHQQNKQKGTTYGTRRPAPSGAATLDTVDSPSEPSNAEVIAAVNVQTKAINGLKMYLQIVIEETVKDELQKARPSTSPPSVSMSPQIASIGNRLSEIEKTLAEFSRNLDGKRLSAASQSLILEAQRNRQAVVSATERLQVQAEENKTLVSRGGAALQQIEKHAGQQIEKAVQRIAGEASRAVTANLGGANKRADQIMAATAMFLTLLPTATVVAGLWIVIAGLFTGVQWATDVDGSVWLGVGRWLAVACGVSVVAYGLFVGARWTTSLVATWKGSGMPR